MLLLTDEQKKFYDENGYVLLDGIFTPQEVEECSQEYDYLFRAKQNQNLEATWEGDWKTKIQDELITVKSIHNLQYHSAVFTRMITNPKLLDALADVMETPNILLHHTKAHLKPPETGASFPMHQDYQYFPYKNDSMVAVFFHLDDSSPENGGLAVFPGSHKLGPLRDMSNANTHHYVDQMQFPLEKATPVHAKKGQIVIFSYLLVHGSYLNTSDRIRRMFLLQVMSADDEPVNDIHKSPGQGLVLRGRNQHRDSDITRRHME